MQGAPSWLESDPYSDKMPTQESLGTLRGSPIHIGTDPPVCGQQVQAALNLLLYMGSAGQAVPRLHDLLPSHNLWPNGPMSNGDTDGQAPSLCPRPHSPILVIEGSESSWDSSQKVFTPRFQAWAGPAGTCCPPLPPGLMLRTGLLR